LPRRRRRPKAAKGADAPTAQSREALLAGAAAPLPRRGQALLARRAAATENYLDSFLYQAPSPVDVHDQVVLASGTITATVEPDLSVEELAAELAGGTLFYVNVHTTACPQGAIAGDLVLQGTA
jgi:hypothetical protein